MSQALLGKPQKRTQLFYWEYGREDFYLKPGNTRFVSPNLAMWEGEWKLLINANSTRIKLYNLKTDWAETTNVAEQYPDIVNSMSKRVLTWRKTVD